MRVCKHGCGVKMFCFSRANHASTNLKKFSSSKLDNFTLFTHSFVGWNIRILESIFLQNKNWLRVQDFVDKTLRLVRISLFISTIQRVLRFSSGNLFYKSNRKLFSCICIAWYKYERGWENSRQLCKPETKSRVCITVEKKVFYCFYKITFPRKNAKLFVCHWLKEKLLPVAKSCPRSLARVISSCFAKRCFPKYGFFSLKMPA